MRKSRITELLYVVGLVFVMLLFGSGCSMTRRSSYMQMLPEGQTAPQPDKDKAMVVFMRATSFGGAIQSSVFEIIDDKASLVGIVSARTKVAYSVEPGERLFTVVGESADFMYANIEAGKIYYALVVPRMGVWKARFSLKPVVREELQSKKLRKWLDSCSWAEKKPEADQWANNNMASILEKYRRNFQKWQNKSESAKPKLMPEDGI